MKNNFLDKPPYKFICKKCKHIFTRNIKFGIFCPKCFSFNVSRFNLTS